MVSFLCSIIPPDLCRCPGTRALPSGDAFHDNRNNSPVRGPAANSGARYHRPDGRPQSSPLGIAVTKDLEISSIRSRARASIVPLSRGRIAQLRWGGMAGASVHGIPLALFTSGQVLWTRKPPGPWSRNGCCWSSRLNGRLYYLATVGVIRQKVEAPAP